MRKVLLISQALNPSLAQLLTEALKDAEITIITGSEITGHVISSPPHDPRSITSRLKCWIAHWRFVDRWSREHRTERFDLIFMTSNPPINLMLGLQLKKRHHAKLVYMNWDLYPQGIEVLMKGVISSSAAAVWHAWNRKNYKKIDQIITIGNVVAESIQETIPDPLHIEVIPIAVDTREIVPIPKEENPFIRENGLSGKFIVLYSGKLGRGHDIEGILSAAKHLESVPDIVFVFIGKGEKRHLVEERIQAGSTNLRLFDLQPREVFFKSIAIGDIGIVAQEKSCAKYFMPSKTYSMMAAGEAIVGLCSDHDDLQQVIENHGIGYAVKSGDPKELADRIKELYNNPDLLQEFQRRSRQTAEEYYSTEAVKQLYETLFDRILGDRT